MPPPPSTAPSSPSRRTWAPAPASSEHLGRPLDLDIFRARVFKPAVARAGLPLTLRFHDLRHTAASLMLQSGSTVRDVMEICGWRQLATAQRYLHPSASLAEAAARLSEARAAALNRL